VTSHQRTQQLASAPIAAAPEAAGVREAPLATRALLTAARRARGYVRGFRGERVRSSRAAATPIGDRMSLAPPAEAARPVPPLRRRRAPRGTRFLLDAVLGATLIAGLHLFVIQVSVVKGHSMEPCLHDGDRLVVDRFAYNFGDVRRGDVVVLRYPKNPAVDFVKRIVGLPGDHLAMQHGVLLVNGEAADDYGCILDVQDLPDQVVPEHQFFVLGDNRPISCDSREFGLVPQDLLKGRVRVRFWPLENASVF
jgi:signal peptidase I